MCFRSSSTTTPSWQVPTDDTLEEEEGELDLGSDDDGLFEVDLDALQEVNLDLEKITDLFTDDDDEDEEEGTNTSGVSDDRRGATSTPTLSRVADDMDDDETAEELKQRLDEERSRLPPGMWTTTKEENLSLFDIYPGMRRVGTTRGGAPMFAGQFELREEDLVEHFIKGGGKGGQKVNKSNNCVSLRHVPTGTVIKCHEHRELHANRKTARRRMRERLEEMVMGKYGRKGKRNARIRKQKARRRRRRRGKDDDGGDSLPITTE